MNPQSFIIKTTGPPMLPFDCNDGSLKVDFTGCDDKVGVDRWHSLQSQRCVDHGHHRPAAEDRLP